MTTEIQAALFARTEIALDAIADHLPAIRAAVEELDLMLDGEMCDHSVGICYCASFNTLDLLKRAQVELTTVANTIR